ncbi:MAG TPA: hypothetical protein VII56_01110 [Rhizomicrobium sp.]
MEKVFVQLRLTPSEAEELRQHGEAEGRKLPAEIMRRVRASLSGSDYSIENALGDLSKIIAAGAARSFGKVTDAKSRAVYLSIVREALNQMLDNLGADATLSEHERAVAASLVWPALIHIRAPDYSPQARETGQVPSNELDLMRIGGALGYPKADKPLVGKGDDNE